jgi:hypothetical protein
MTSYGDYIILVIRNSIFAIHPVLRSLIFRPSCFSLASLAALTIALPHLLRTGLTGPTDGVGMTRLWPSPASDVAIRFGVEMLYVQTGAMIRRMWSYLTLRASRSKVLAIADEGQVKGHCVFRWGKSIQPLLHDPLSHGLADGKGCVRHQVSGMGNIQ